jgi:hypothetical protein
MHDTQKKIFLKNDTHNSGKNSELDSVIRTFKISFCVYNIA